MYTQKSESQKHQDLVSDLLYWLKNTKGYSITGADLEGYTQPGTVENTDKVGDGENKIPDIDAKDIREDVFIRGEAKTGEGDLETLHTETQFRLFSDRYNSSNKKESMLYIIVPGSKYQNLLNILTDLGLDQKSNIIPVKSGIIA